MSASPWKVEPVRRVLVREAIELIGPDAWVVDDTGFTKDGSSSPCAARQYSGTLGKIGNCQIAVSIHAATDKASCPLNWRVFVPESWDGVSTDTNEHAARVAARRAKAGLQHLQRHRTKWAMAGIVTPPSSPPRTSSSPHRDSPAMTTKSIYAKYQSQHRREFCR